LHRPREAAVDEGHNNEEESADFVRNEVHSNHDDAEIADDDCEEPGNREQTDSINISNSSECGRSMDTGINHQSLDQLSLASSDDGEICFEDSDEELLRELEAVEEEAADDLNDRNTSAWLAAADLPVCELVTGSMTVREAAFSVLHLLHTTSCTFSSATKWLALTSWMIFNGHSAPDNPSNRFPPSLYVCNLVAGTPDLAKFEHHLCPEGCIYQDASTQALAHFLRCAAVCMTSL
jgi:hypothetical protein